MNTAFPAVEKEFIAKADAVVTVSPEIAEVIRKDYGLAKTPLVVRNTPIRETIGGAAGRVSVRQACGLDDGVPLLVYSGWISSERGLGTAVEGLAQLPGYHLAIVAGKRSRSWSGCSRWPRRPAYGTASMWCPTSPSTRWRTTSPPPTSD